MCGVRPPHAAAVTTSSWGIQGQLALGNLQVTCLFWTSFTSEVARPGIGVGNLPCPQALLSLWSIHSGAEAGTGGQTMSPSDCLVNI